MIFALGPVRDAASITLPDDRRVKLLAATLQPPSPGVRVMVVGAGAGATATATATALLIDPEHAPRQVLKVAVANAGNRAVTSKDPLTVSVRGQLSSPEPAVVSGLEPGGLAIVEIGVTPSAADQFHEGTVVPVDVTAATSAAVDTIATSVAVPEQGWTVHMVSHFHYDPVWWNTQDTYTESWLDAGWQHPGLVLVKAHLDMARRDPDYKFILAEVDYLKRYWNHHPADLEYMKQLLREGRLGMSAACTTNPAQCSPARSSPSATSSTGSVTSVTCSAATRSPRHRRGCRDHVVMGPRAAP